MGLWLVLRPYVSKSYDWRLGTDGEPAGVLRHETGQVVTRHTAEQLAIAQLTQGLTGAAVMAACDPNSPSGSIAASQLAAVVGQLINMQYSRADETEADSLGVRFMNDISAHKDAPLRRVRQA